MWPVIYISFRLIPSCSARFWFSHIHLSSCMRLQDIWREHSLFWWRQYWLQQEAYKSTPFPLQLQIQPLSLAIGLCFCDLLYGALQQGQSHFINFTKHWDLSTHTIKFYWHPNRSYIIHFARWLARHQSLQLMPHGALCLWGLFWSCCASVSLVCLAREGRTYFRDRHNFCKKKLQNNYRIHLKIKCSKISLRYVSPKCQRPQHTRT